MGFDVARSLAGGATSNRMYHRAAVLTLKGAMDRRPGDRISLRERRHQVRSLGAGTVHRRRHGPNPRPLGRAGRRQRLQRGGIGHGRIEPPGFIMARVRARVEHGFAAMERMGGKRVRCIGLDRATFQLTGKAAVYNPRRPCSLKACGVAAC